MAVIADCPVSSYNPVRVPCPGAGSQSWNPSLRTHWALPHHTERIKATWHHLVHCSWGTAIAFAPAGDPHIQRLRAKWEVWDIGMVG